MPYFWPVSAERRQRIERLATSAVALDTVAGLRRINNDSAIADTSRPGVDRVGDRIDLLGVAGAQRNRVRPLEIAVHLVIAGQAIASPEREDRE
jgi:hypothetical protein